MITWTQSTQDQVWQDRGEVEASAIGHRADGTIKGLSLTGERLQALRGFGGCFNEIGWLPLLKLSEADRQEVMRKLFSPDECNFVFDRAPIGANDFAASWYSFDETVGDYALNDFSVEHDDGIIVPYIKAAQQWQPGLTVHASPWSPPTWMKFPAVYNYGHIVQTPENLSAYAQYFVRYVEEYAKRGIRVAQVFPQNEMWSDAKYPTCRWTSEELRVFIRDYMGPAFEKAGLLDGTNPVVNQAFGEGSKVEIWLGTLNGPRDGFGNAGYGVDLKDDNYNRYVDNILFDDEARRYISGIGYQWEGRNCIARTHADWPEIDIVQTESECGVGNNSWEYAEYIFGLVRHYLANGASGYTYWNMVLAGTSSTWGWKQNSLVTVDEQEHSYRLNPEYYVMRHYSHYVKPGARVLAVAGRFGSQASAYENPDGSIAVVAQNALDRELPFAFDGAALERGDAGFTVTLEPHSFNTFLIK